MNGRKIRSKRHFSIHSIIFSKKLKYIKIQRTMKVFRTLKSYYEILGISSSYHSDQRYSLNPKVPIVFVLFGCMIFSHFIYIFRVANDYIEYEESISSTTGCIIVFVGFVSIVFKSHTLFDVIDKMEKFIATSENYSN